MMEDLLRCPQCGFIGTIYDFEADDDNLFCPMCNLEDQMEEVSNAKP